MVADKCQYFNEILYCKNDQIVACKSCFFRLIKSDLQVSKKTHAKFPD